MPYTLEKVRLLSTSASIIVEKMLNRKTQFNEQSHNFQQHAEFTLIEQIKKNKQPLKDQEHFYNEEKISGF